MSITLSKHAVDAMKYLRENISDISDTEIHLYALVLEAFTHLSAHRGIIAEYDEIMDQLTPLLAEELEFRARSTQGTV